MSGWLISSHAFGVIMCCMQSGRRIGRRQQFKSAAPLPDLILGGNVSFLARTMSMSLEEDDVVEIGRVDVEDLPPATASKQMWKMPNQGVGASEPT
ncbi:hypothetical protein IFR04_011855 [Cadophora malorum]|uniref:Uncharacterized protein n=1 Tax=Cadophora malorum TaxID=108018 RepID=A0A8H7W8R2_9HELO|nr:hypothetical protein IFR04_011855 [Cadophora malorum]